MYIRRLCKQSNGAEYKNHNKLLVWTFAASTGADFNEVLRGC